MAFPLGFCWLAVDTFQILGIWLALALVVLDSNCLVYTLALDWLAMVAGLVGLVGMVVVDFSLDFLGILVDNFIQRGCDLALA